MMSTTRTQALSSASGRALSATVGVLLVCNNSHAFVLPPRLGAGAPAQQRATPLSVATIGSDWDGTSAARNDGLDFHFLLEDFKTATGDLVDPYRILKLSRTAGLSSIKQSYRELSRQFHPDMVRHRATLPGRCTNLDHVRDEWEKIKLSYEILSDKRMRQKYDRNSAIADPSAAIARAAVNVAEWGVAGVGKSLSKVGEVAFNQMEIIANECGRLVEERLCDEPGDVCDEGDKIELAYYAAFSDEMIAPEPERNSRNTAITDPGARIARVAGYAVGRGLGKVEKSLLMAKEVACNQLANIADEWCSKENESPWNLLDDVHDEWERLKQSYEIRSDQNVMRQEDDRNGADVKPAAAIAGAVLGNLGSSLEEVEKGVVKFGEDTFNKLANIADEWENRLKGSLWHPQ